MKVFIIALALTLNAGPNTLPAADKVTANMQIKLEYSTQENCATALEYLKSVDERPDMTVEYVTECEPVDVTQQ